MFRTHPRATIGFLSANIHLGAARSLWHGVVNAVKELDTNLVCFPGGGIGIQTEWEDQRNIIYDLVNTNQLDGLLSWATTLGVALPHSEVVEFHKRFGPLPLISLALPMKGIPSISVNSYAGMRSAIVHLLEVHHVRRVAFIRGPENHYYAQERYRAYREVLAEYGVEMDGRLVTPPLAWEAGLEGMRIFLDERRLAPGVDFEAVVAVNDLMALEAIKILQARDVQVPEQVAVVGFNDSTEGRLTSPPLTSVTPPLHDQGHRAVEELLGIIEGKPAPEQVLLPTHLAIRQSCGCPPQTVVEAAIGPQAMQGGSMLTSSKARREQLMAEIMKTVAKPEWPYQLLTAFDAAMNGASNWIFLNAFEKILRQVPIYDGDLMAWQGVISSLRRYSLPDLDDAARLRCEDLCGQARVIIGEMAQWAQAYQQLQAERQAETLREIGQALITTFDQVFPTQQLVPETLLPVRRFSLVVEPLFFREEPIGFLLLEIGPLDGMVYEVLRSQISSALKGALLFREAQGQRRQLIENEALLKELTIRDVLTGLFNRRYLEETLAREMNRSIRKQNSLGIIMIDIDHFKQFNDRYGHATGDELLRQLGAAFRLNIRESDVACRYGGEEFILVLPETSLEVTQERAERLREAAKHLQVDFEGQPVEMITISLGVAVSPEHGVTTAEVLKAADIALYMAKNEGRDRVVVARIDMGNFG